MTSCASVGGVGIARPHDLQRPHAERSRSVEGGGLVVDERRPGGLALDPFEHDPVDGGVRLHHTTLEPEDQGVDLVLEPHRVDDRPRPVVA